MKSAPGPAAKISSQLSFHAQQLDGVIEVDLAFVAFGQAELLDRADALADEHRAALGIDILHVPYKGAAQALTDLLGGQVQLAVLPVHTALPHARAGKLTVIAVSGESRSVLAPDSPSFAELGLKNLDIDLYFWIAGPAGLPREIVQKWNREIASILSAPEVRETLMKQGMVPAPGSPEEISAQIRADVERWKKFIAETGITAD